MELEKVYRGMENGAETIQENFSKLSKAFYPIGSIFQSTVNTDPETLFGGTWERIKGKVLVGLDESDSSFNGVSKTGGTKNQNYKITPNTAQAQLQLSGSTIGGFAKTTTQYTRNVRNTSSMTLAAESTTSTSGIGVNGETELGNNLQPYYTVYIWIRKA